MGVKFLSTFISKFVPNGQSTVKIGEEIERWKSENEDPIAEPVILIDMYSLWGGFSNSDSLMGGRYHLVLKYYEKFFQKLTSFGAKLIFFCRGLPSKDVNGTKKIRKDKLYFECIEILDEVKEHGNVYFVDKIPKAISRQSILLPLTNLCQRYGELKMVGENKIYSELALFSSIRHVLAIVADNMKYLIYGGEWKLWSTRSVDVTQFTVIEFNRVAMKKELRLTDQQLHILATIAGNNIIPYEDVRQFHKRLNTKYWNHFYKLANYIRVMPLDMTVEEVSRKVSNEIYGSEEGVYLRRVAESINMYDISGCNNLDNPKKTQSILISNSTHNRFMHAILLGEPITVVLLFMDLRRTDFVPYLDLVEPILRRAIGVIRSQVKCESNYMQVVRAKVQHDEPYTDILIAPEYAKHLEIPKDLLIGNGDNDLRHHQLRLDIVKWIIFGEDSIKLNFEQIPRGYIVTVLTLKYLLKFEQVTTVEADSILLCTFNVHNNRVPANIILQNVAVRTIIISNLYAKLYLEILLCFITVGLERSITDDFLMYDGLHFADLFINLLNASDGGYENAILDILSLRKLL